MNPNDYSTIENYVKSMGEVSERLHTENPDVILAPMFGAVPFVDVLNIIDPNFENEKVIYVPASSKLHKVKDVMRGAFESIINSETPDGGSYISLDEVVSGNSLVRVFKQFDAARTAYANKLSTRTYTNADFRDENIRYFRDQIINSINYKSIGIVDSKLERLGKNMSKQYESLVDDGIAIPVKTDCIVTMDRDEFFPAKYKTNTDSEGSLTFLPVVDSFSVSKKYIDFLQTVAMIQGIDPETIGVANMGRIRSSYKHVPEELRKI